MDDFVLRTTIESFVDWVMVTDPQTVRNYVEALQAEHPSLTRRELAQKVVEQQSLSNGLLGAATGFGGMMTLPIALPFDVFKTWRIQDFTIRCVAHLYGYTPQNTDLKTAILLLMSSGSLEELKQFAVSEATNAVNRSAFAAVDALKTSAIQVAATEAPKQMATAIAKYSETFIATFGLQEASRLLLEAIYRVAGKKVAETLLQNSLSLAVPMVGAAIGGGMDWMTTQAVGQLAIEYFEHSGPEYINSALGITD